jgi:hypothetical protein
LAKWIPGFCPMWSGCFRRCCIAAEQSLRDARMSSSIVEYMYMQLFEQD